MYVRTFKTFKTCEGLVRLLTLLIALQLQDISNFNMLPIQIRESHCEDSATRMTPLIYVGLDLSLIFLYLFSLPVGSVTGSKIVLP